MPLSKLMNRPCTLLLRSDEDDSEFDPTPGNEDRVETVCEIQQLDRDEREEHAETSDTRWLVILPAGTQLDTGDAIRVDGLGTFEVVGAPEALRNPRTRRESHVEATVRRTVGSEAGS